MVAREGVEPPTTSRFRAALCGGKLAAPLHAASELLPQESNNFPRFVAVVAIPRRQSVPELCLQVLQAIFRTGDIERKIHAKRKHDANRTTRRTRRLEIPRSSLGSATLRKSLYMASPS